MSAVPAYSQPYEHEAERAFESPRIDVIPGGRTQVQTLSPAVITLSKIVAVALVVLALIGFARVALNSAAVTTAMESKQYTNLIEEARSSGGSLEVTQSSLSNPTRVKTEATALGMVAPENIETIVLSEDVVALNDAGNLSLSRSLAVAAKG